MSRYIVIFSIALVASIGSVQRAISQEDIERTLTRAQNLSYEARFKDSVDLLLPADAALRQRPSPRRPDQRKTAAGAQLHWSESDSRSESRFSGSLRSGSGVFPGFKSVFPKVVALFNDAKAERKKISCEARCGQIDKLSKSGDVAGLLTLANEGSPAAAASRLLVQLTCSSSRNWFRLPGRTILQELSERFRPIKFRPDLDVAIQYAELADGKMTIATEQMLLNWRKLLLRMNFRRLQVCIGDSSRPTLKVRAPDWSRSGRNTAKQSY